MAKLLIATMPFISHINPSLPIARELVRRGHEVWWYTGKKLQAKVEATGVRYVPMNAAPDFDEDKLAEVFPEWARLKPVPQFKWSIKHIFMDAAPGQLQDIQAILREFPADAILSETTFAGGQFTYELGGPPWAAFNILPLTITSRDTAPFGLGLMPNASPLGHVRNHALNWLFNQVLFRDVVTHFKKVRESVGLPRTSVGEFGLSPFLYLQGTTQAFEYPRSDLPPQVHFIGPFLPEAPATFHPPAWWYELERRERPIVLVTQGTVATDSWDLMIPALRALANENVLVIATTGGKPVADIGVDPLPSNVRIEPFIPYAHLMPHIDIMITNGGYGSVQLALAHGVPIVTAGKTQEKPEICNRVAWTGVGIDLKTQHPTLEQVRTAVRTILANPGYRAKARQVQADFAQHHAPTEAAQLVEQLALTKQPVLRGQVIHAPQMFAGA